MKKFLFALALIVPMMILYSCNNLKPGKNTAEAKTELPSQLWNVTLGECIDSVIQILNEKNIPFSRGLNGGNSFSITAKGDLPFENALFDRAHIYFNHKGCTGVLLVKEFDEKEDAIKLYNAISNRYTRKFRSLLTPVAESECLKSDIFKESSKIFKVLLDSTSNYISVAPVIEIPSFNVSVCLIDTLQLK